MMTFKYISAISEEELQKEVVIPCVDEEGFSCILIKNSVEKTIVNSYSTDNLDIKLNRILLKDDVKYYFHVIKAKKFDIYGKKQFEVIYNYVFKKIKEPVSDIELGQLITSLEDYFKTTPDQNTLKLQVGVYGELLCVFELYNHGYTEILDKFHTNFYSKHDVEISSSVRLEIKTNLGESRIHSFKHNQICRDDVDVYIGSVLLEKAKKGVSLYDMFVAIQEVCDNADLLFALDKLMIKCGVDDENVGLTCSYDLAKENLKWFSALSAPHLDKYHSKVDGITNIQYDVDCEKAEFINIEDLIKIFR